MMRILKLIFAFALMAGITSAFADPPSQVGRLNYLYGTVSFAPAEANDDWTGATLNRPITTGDRLWADRDGRAEMHIGSAAIRMSALTSLDVLRLDDSGAQLRLAQGSMNVRLRRLDPNENFEIATPGGSVVLTQPGSYRVNVDPSGATTTVLVRRGQADVLTGSAPFAVRDNQLASISPVGQEIFAAPAADEFDNWAATRDQREDSVAATRYVGEEMTGYEDLDQYGSWRAVEEYGSVWVPAGVSSDWAPYRQGHWVWISPWGWTWVDDAPWGFAPYHYGRWIWLGNHWAWAPGTRVARPVYAPALVAFVGGANWSISVGAGPAVGWVPLGWREPYIPWYRTSPAYVRHVNVTHVTNITVINQYANTRNINNIRYVNRGVPTGVTVVPRTAFVSARPVQQSFIRVPAQTLSNARITHDAPVTRPERASYVGARPGPRLPAAVAAREVVAIKAPPARVNRDTDAGINRARPANRDDRPRVRVLSPQQSTHVPVQQPVPQSRNPQPSTQGDAKGRTGNVPTPAQPGSQVERREQDRNPRVNVPSAQPQIDIQRQQQMQQEQQRAQRQQEEQQRQREQQARQQEQQRQQQLQQRQVQQEQARQQAQQQARQQAQQREQQQARQQEQQRLQEQRELQRQQQTQQRQVQQEQARQNAQRQQQEQQQARLQAQQQARQQQEMQQRQTQQEQARQQQERRQPERANQPDRRQQGPRQQHENDK